MNKRPDYTVPANTAPEIAAMLLAAAKRKTVYIDPNGDALWLNHDRAVAIHARHGGQLFPAEQS